MQEENAEYRELNRGEDVEAGDEYLNDEKDEWILIDDAFLSIIRAIGMSVYYGSPITRRKV